MKKFLATLFVTCGALTLSGCANGIPECNNATLDNCGRNSAYTEERTIGVMGPRPAPAPEPVMAPEPVPEPVVEAPPPEPAPEPVDTQIMQKADEPSYVKGLK